MYNLLIVWKESDMLGVPIIDEQHRGFVSIINALHFEIKKNRGMEALPHIVTMIREYGKMHFRAEEELMAAAGYPGLAKHRELHAALIVGTLHIGNESLLMNDPLKFLEFLEDWWVNHIRIQDPLCAGHVRAYMENL